MLGSIKDQWRVAHAKTDGGFPRRLAGSIESGGANVDAAELTGKFYRVVDEVVVLPDGKVQLKGVPTTTDKEWVILTFHPKSGEGEFEWKFD